MTNENSCDDISTDIVHKEIDLIQGCINRMASNSFLLKGWLISLITIIIVFLINKDKLLIVSLLALPIILIFWCLDSFFLNIERLYRKKYNWIISERLNGNNKFLYDLSPYNKEMWLEVDKLKKAGFFDAMFSTTLLLFYGLPSISLIFFLVFKLFCYK